MNEINSNSSHYPDFPLDCEFDLLTNIHHHLPQPAKGRPKAAEKGKKPDAAPPAKMKAKADLLEGLQRANTVLQRKQVELLQETYQSEDQGVEAQKAF